MPLTEKTKFFIGILEDGQIEFRRTLVILDGTEVVGEKHHRQVLEPGQDVSIFPKRIKDVTSIIWTPQVIDAYQKAKDTRSRI